MTLRGLREVLDVGLRDLAERSSLSPGAVTMIEKAQRVPRPETIVQICEGIASFARERGNGKRES